LVLVPLEPQVRLVVLMDQIACFPRLPQQAVVMVLLQMTTLAMAVLVAAVLPLEIEIQRELELQTRVMLAEQYQVQ
jgi:hypothetical protein